jgi:hypothetical protein
MLWRVDGGGRKVCGTLYFVLAKVTGVMQSLCRHSGLLFAEVSGAATLAVFQIQTRRIDDETRH